ncbi:hypothetical protein B0H13DRAFT_1955553 [Mycena leptocephala]|nr:hypothetical protein B0H13DRAFT_1955553 [Mycena leptocephala]
MPQSSKFFTLPPEIIVHIFETLIVDLGDTPPEPVILRLSSICRDLRALAINSPTLWSHIHLRSLPIDRDMNGVHLFIQRSQDCLLEVSVYFDFLDPLAIQSYAVTRWRKLTIRAPRSSYVKHFLHAIVDIPTPHLSEVSLLPRERSDCAGEHLPLLSGASDALRTLTMHGCISCLASFPHLTKLNIFRLECTYEEFRDLIQGSPNLTTLILGELLDHFGNETLSDAVPARRALIEAPFLRFFAVGFTNVDLILTRDRPLLVFLSMPNLEYLEVVGSRADYGELSGKDFPALKRICLRDMSFPASDTTIYRSFTKITCLELYNVQGMGLLTAPDENGALPWPHLQTLRCRFSDEEDCSWLEKMVDRRPRLMLEVPNERKDDVVAIARTHDVRVLSDDLLGLIRGEDFQRAEWEEDEDDEYSDSNFSDEVDFFDDEDNYDFEYDGMEDEVDDYFDDEDDDDGLEGVVGWL